MAAKGAKKGPKQPRTAVSVESAKVPRILPGAEQGRRYVSWRFAHMDMGGDWSCLKMDGETLLGIRKKLIEYEKKTWAESSGTGSVGVIKEIPTESISSKAQKRLEALKLDDAPQLCEFRLTSKQRVWGVRLDQVCYVLWWDPDHTVFKSDKKGT